MSQIWLFLEVAAVKKIVWLFGFFFFNIWLFWRQFAHAIRQVSWVFKIKILLKSVTIIGFLGQCFVYFLFKHVALPVRPIHHKLIHWYVIFKVEEQL